MVPGADCRNRCFSLRIGANLRRRRTRLTVRLHVNPHRLSTSVNYLVPWRAAHRDPPSLRTREETGCGRPKGKRRRRVTSAGRVARRRHRIFGRLSFFRRGAGTNRPRMTTRGESPKSHADRPVVLPIPPARRPRDNGRRHHRPPGDRGDSRRRQLPGLDSRGGHLLRPRLVAPPRRRRRAGRARALSRLRVRFVLRRSSRRSPPVAGRSAGRDKFKPRLSPRAGKAPLESFANLGVFGEHRHPYRPESACLCQHDYPLNICTFCDALSRYLGVAPRFATFPPSQVACPRIVRRPPPQSDEIEQVLRLRSIRLWNAGTHSDDAIGQVLEHRLSIVLVGPEVAVPRRVPVLLRSIAVRTSRAGSSSIHVQGLVQGLARIVEE